MSMESPRQATIPILACTTTLKGTPANAAATVIIENIKATIHTPKEASRIPFKKPCNFTLSSPLFHKKIEFTNLHR
jgi:hypothetical protein